MLHECNSLLAAFELLDTLQASTWYKCEPEAITRAHKEYMEYHVEAYATELGRPKHHFLGHVGPQFKRDRDADDDNEAVYFDALCLERALKVPKQLGKIVMNTSRYERTVYSRHLLEHKRRLADYEFGD